MAFPVSPFEKLTVPQMDVLSAERNKIGMHTYFSGGFDARKKKYSCIVPGDMLDRCALTIFFENVSPVAGPLAYLRLGRYNEHEKNYVQVSMSDTNYDALRNFGGTSASLPLMASPSPVKGPHVLQFFRGGNSMEVYIDQQLLFSKTSLLQDVMPERLVVFYANQSSGQTSPFVFHEAHWSVPDPKRSIETNPSYRRQEYGFYHPDIYVRVGGYVLWSGVWDPNKEIRLYYGPSVASVNPPASGEAVVVVKIYRNGFTYSHAQDVDTAPLITQYTSFDLGRLFMTYPQTLTEYKAVTGEIIY